MMPVYRGIRELPASFGPVVAAIGNFDGVHLGHQEILSSVVEEARRRQMKAVAITFDPHPEQFLRPAEFAGLLTPMDHRLSLLASTGVDAVVALIFDEPLSRLTPRQFVEQVLRNALGVAGLHEGGNFRFGHRASAGVNELVGFGREFGFSVALHSAVRVHSLEVSSSAVRALVQAGDMRRARWMLSRPFAIRGVQQRDRGVGARLLVPTVNLAPYQGLLPANGVYVTQLKIGERCFRAVTNAGNRPTFAGAGFSIESHILDFEPVDMDADTPLELQFLLRLREEKRFDSTDALKAQILKDVARAKRFFRLASSV
jgi:riboflavin kinase/FMN adenylyltransferase